KKDERITKDFLMNEFRSHVKYLGRRKRTAPPEEHRFFDNLIEKFERWEQNIKDDDSSNYKSIYISFQNEKKVYEKEFRRLKKENESLKQEICDNNVKIRELENQIGELKISVEDLDVEIERMEIDNNQKIKDLKTEIEELSPYKKLYIRENYELTVETGTLRGQKNFWENQYNKLNKLYNYQVKADDKLYKLYDDHLKARDKTENDLIRLIDCLQDENKRLESRLN
ncbi:30347_t:CDS:2, partial [Racocetra persica]